MILAVLASRALSGMDAVEVGVETHLASVLPTFGIVGLQDVEVHESRERVRAAILNSGFNFPAGRLTVTICRRQIFLKNLRVSICLLPWEYCWRLARSTHRRQPKRVLKPSCGWILWFWRGVVLGRGFGAGCRAFGDRLGGGPQHV